MADIELVIKIPKDEYRWIVKSDKTVFADIASKECMLHAIKNGIPLPKGHGELKDTDAICKNIISALGIRDENYLLEAEKAVYKRIKNAPTIIPADKDGEMNEQTNKKE